MSSSILLSPLTIRKTTLRNRIMLPSMVTHYCAVNGEVSERLIAYHAERAYGGVGLNMLESTSVDDTGKSYWPGVSIASDHFIKGLRRLTDAIHAHGGKAGIQLNHAGRLAQPAVSGHPRQLVSYIPGLTTYDDIHVMDEDDIERVIGSFCSAAERAAEAGFDVVEIHGAHGYLISQFVSPLTNHREDAYGGSLENRLRMPLAVIRAIRKAVGDDFPISYRHNADDGLPGGMTLEETLQLVNPLVDAGVDALHISAGIGETKHLISPPSCTPEAWLSDGARQVKEAVRNRVPVISVGRYVHPAIADQVIRDGKADMVAFGRALIAEPELINKYAENRLDSARVCLGCNEGCTGHTGKLLDITCAINPRAGYEGKYPLGVKADKALKVAVVGAGPAGLQAALTAAQRGHSVTLFERGEDIGGLLHPASRPPFKDSLMELVRYFRHELDALGVNIRCGVTVTGRMLQAQAFDMTLLATGSRPVIPRFAAELPNMTTAEHILLEAIKPGHRVLIIGGGMIGCELADFLGERGHAVTILEMRPEVAQDMEWRARHTLMPRLERYGVTLLTGMEIMETANTGRIRIRDAYGVEEWLEPFDTTAISVGYRPEKMLARELEHMRLPYKAIGDCVAPGKILDAMHQGLAAAYAL